MDDIIKIVVLNDGNPLVTKIQELPGRDIGEPDCLLIDPCGLYFPAADNVQEFMMGSPHHHHHDHDGEDHKHSHEQEQGFALSRYMPKKFLADCRMPISSANILTILEPSPLIVSEYLITISD